MGVVGDLAADHPGVGIAREVEELFDLVAPDVAQDAPVALPLEEPRGPRRQVGPVRAHPDDLKDPPEGALQHQLAGEHGALDVDPLAVVDGVLAAGALHRPAGLGQLVERRQGRLVREVVLALGHHPQAQGGMIGRHGRAGHELHPGSSRTSPSDLATRTPGNRSAKRPAWPGQGRRPT